MAINPRWYGFTAVVLLTAAALVLPVVPATSTVANAQPVPAPAAKAKRPARERAKPAPAKPAETAPPPVAEASQPRQLPPRTQFTAADEAAAVIPDMPDARFWVDSVADFSSALPAQPGPWLILSSGGSDGAFGAGVLNGLSASGHRPDYAVVTGVSTGALMAPFAFVGARYDEALRAAYTKITAADIFEAGGTGESFADSWPLKDLIAKQITPELLADIATAHHSGRRLFVVTTDLDAGRSVVWNMGAIAAHGGDAALNLFRRVLLASSAIPGGFPPVLIGVEANGKKFAEMHVDGGVGGQFFVAPPALLVSTSDYRIPATQLDVIVNSGLNPDFAVVERSTPLILTAAVSAAVEVDTRLMLDRTYIAAKRGGVPFNVATIPASFNAQSRGPFDPIYMGALFQAGFDLGKSTTPFGHEPPPYPAPLTGSAGPAAAEQPANPVALPSSAGSPERQSQHGDKPGAEK